MGSEFTNQLKKRMPDEGEPNWKDERDTDDQIDDVVMGALLTSNRVSSDCEVSDGGGLYIDFADGYVYVAGELVKITGDTLLLAGGLAGSETGQQNWVYVDDTGTPQASTTPPFGDYVPLAMVDCDDTSVLRIADLRPVGPGRYQMVENDCINGTFQHWQRATSQTTSGYGSDDRFDNLHAGSSKTHSQQAFTVGQTDVPGNPEFYSRTVVTSSAGAANYVKKAHKVLDVRKYSGKRVCIVFDAKADAAKNIALEGEQNFGVGGSATVSEISAQKIALTTSWAKYVVFIDFESISWASVGPLSFSQINFWFDAGSDFNTNSDTLGQQSGTFDISEVKIYVSDKELPVRRRTAEEELALCQAYLFLSSAANPLYRNINFASYTSSVPTNVQFPVTMIATPTVTAEGDISEGASFTTWDTIVANTGGCLLLKGSISSGNYVDLHWVKAIAEL